MMLRFFYISIPFLAFYSAQAQWTQLNSGTTEALTSVYFLNQDTGFVVGFSGTILKTTDGGATWLPKNSNTNTYLAQVVFTDDNNGIIVGDSGIVLRTTDGGETWSKQSVGSNLVLYSVDFSSANSGIAVGTKGSIFKTNNGGISWNRLPAIPLSGDTTYSLNSVRPFGSLVWYAAGGYINTSGMMLKSVDGGNTWMIIYDDQPSSDDELISVFPLSSTAVWSYSNAFCVNQRYTVLLYTPNGGSNWFTQSCTPFCYCSRAISDGMFFINSQYGFIAGVGGDIIYTYDGGLSWWVQNIDPISDFDAIFFVDNMIGYIVGMNGKIYKTTNAGGIIGVDEPFVLNSNFTIYPNPSNGKFFLHSNKSLSQSPNEPGIRIINSLGQLLDTRIIPVNSKEFLIDISNYPEGLYFINVIYSNDENYTQKIINIK